MDFVRPYSFDRPLFFATLILLTLGVVMVFGTSGILASEKFHQPFHYMVQQAIGAAVGLALVIGLLPLRRPLYENTYVVNGLLILTVALLVLCFAMPTVAKSNRWVILGNIRFQPSELAKISLVLYVAWFIDRTRERIRDPRLVLIPLGITGLVTVLVLREPDFGTGVFIFGLGLAVLFLGGMRFKHLAGLVLIVPPALTAYLLAAPYRVDRVRAIL
jgi:cell division protein FtsW